ncbi:PilZ domain-containing protein [Desulfobacter curvatus]|uniref:PilZ domain-containing protein n=1 Tax=Desulfobacter curvatus TaxID=2290 RepID=UPI0003635527|nr:PilZ domain-containing protein [Desulfobacter curvatus]
MSEDSIDFQPIPEENTEGGQIRHLFRMSVSLTDDIRANFGENEYLVTNLSETGIAVNVSSCLEFESGQIIDDARLRIGNVNITGLRAKVIHCSVHDSGSFQIGLQWVGMNAENKKILETALGQLKVKALKVQDLFEEHPKS